MAELRARGVRAVKRVSEVAGGLAARGVFEGGARLAGLHPDNSLRRHGLRRLRDIPYSDSRAPDHTLDVFLPPGEGPHPVLLYIHGGGFRILSKDTHWHIAAAHAQRGYVVFNINYRLAPEHPFPAAIHDALEATAWVLDHAARYNGDLSKGFVIGGESAGANLALGVTIASCFERPDAESREVFGRGVVPDALLAIYGMLQVSDVPRYWAKRPMAPIVKDRINLISSSYLGDPEAHPHHLRDLADPLCLIERDDLPTRALPPTFAPVGTRDPVFDDTIRLGDALRRRGVPCEAPVYLGGLHGFHAVRWSPLGARCWHDMDRFLGAHGAGEAR